MMHGKLHGKKKRPEQKAPAVRHIPNFAVTAWSRINQELVELIAIGWRNSVRRNGGVVGGPRAEQARRLQECSHLPVQHDARGSIGNAERVGTGHEGTVVEALHLSRR